MLFLELMRHQLFVICCSLATLFSCVQSENPRLFRQSPSAGSAAHASGGGSAAAESGGGAAGGPINGKISGLSHDECIRFANAMKKGDYIRVTKKGRQTLCGVGSRHILNKLFGRSKDAPYNEPHVAACKIGLTQLNGGGLGASSGKGYKYVQKKLSDLKGGVPEGTVVVCDSTSGPCSDTGNYGHIEVLMGGLYQFGAGRNPRPYCETANNKRNVRYYVLEKV